MYKFDYNGNDGRCNPKPGEVKEAKCGICGAQMNVERDVLGATHYIEAVLGRSHLYDRFVCPNLTQEWHREIFNLKRETQGCLISVVHKSGRSLDYMKNYVKSKEFIDYEKKLMMKLNKKVIKIFKTAQKEP